MKLRGRPPKSDEMPFLDHLEELRWRILWSAVALVIGAVAGFLLVSRFDVLALLVRPIQPWLEGGKLRYLSPADPFFITLKLGLIAGVVLASPVILYQFWAFVSPALHAHEKRAIIPALFFGLLLFAGGMSLAYFGVLPIALRFFAGFQQQSLAPTITIGPYLGFVLKLLLGFGVIFETPVVMLVLGLLGVVTSDMLRRTRRYAIVLIFVVAAVLTPPDVVSQTMMALPLLLLYQISIWLVVWAERRHRRAVDALRDEPPEPPYGPAEPQDGPAESSAGPT